jgi:hypothetical protein
MSATEILHEDARHLSREERFSAGHLLGGPAVVRTGWKPALKNRVIFPIRLGLRRLFSWSYVDF